MGSKVEHIERVAIGARVDLVFNSVGFKFVLSGNTPAVDELFDWEKWRDSWQPYRRDGISQKVGEYLRGLPEHKKIKRYYYELVFHN